MIAGFQPLSLLDYPGKACSIIFTQGCLLRCAYCHNPELIPLSPETRVQSSQTADTFPALYERLEKRKKMVDAVCVTGGEPTIHPGLPELIRGLKERGFFIKLDTNGVRPDVVAPLLNENLVDYVAMDLKAPWERYAEVIRVANPFFVESIKKTFTLIQASGVDHEFRTTIAPGVHMQDDFSRMAGYLRDGEQYVIQQTQFKKTLDPNLTHDDSLSAEALIDSLRTRFPALILSCR